MRVGELNALLKLEGKSQFDRDVDGSGKRFSSLASVAKNTGQAMATTFVAASASMVGLGASVFKTGVSYNTLQQSSRAALTTLLGSAEKANAQMDKLDDFASNSPFAKDVFIKAQQQLIGFGFAAEDVVPTLQAVQDATAAIGGSNQDIADIVSTLAKISSSGKVTAQDLNELGNKGIDAASLIGKEFDKSGAEIREMITRGQITADEAINAITSQMTTQFGGAAANVKDTMVGATDRIKAAWRDIGSDLAAPFVDPNGGGRAVKWVNEVADVMRAMQKQVAPIMEIVMDRWSGAFGRITPTLKKLKREIDALEPTALIRGLDALDGYGGIIAGLAAAFGAWGTAALPIIGGINPIVAGVTALVLATPQLRDGMDRVLAAAMPLVSEFGELGVQVADLALQVITEFAPAFFDLTEAVVNAATPLAGPMTDAIGGLITIATPFIDLLSTIVGWMSELPEGALLAGGAFLLLKGNMGGLKGSLETLAIKGMLAGDTLRDMKMEVAAGHADGLSTKTQLAATGMLGLEVGARKVGTALKTAFIANAPALAIAGIVTVISKIAGNSREAKKYVDDLADSFDDVTGAATAATEALVAEKLMSLDEWDQMVQIAEDAGFSLDTYTQALLGNEEAQRIVEDAMSDVTLEAELTANGYRRVAEDGETLIGVLDREADKVSVARDERAQYNEVVGNTSGTEEAISAAERLTDVIGDEVDAIQTLIDKRREERGEALTLAETQIADAQAREEMLAVMEKEGALLTENGDLFDAYTEKGKYAIEATRGVSDSMEKSAQSMAAAGAEIPEITAALEDQYDAWIETAIAMDIPEEKAHELAAAYGLLPAEIATDAYLEATGIMETLEDIEFEINETTGEITILGNSGEAEQTLAEIIGDVNDADGTVEINGNHYPGWLTLEQFLNEIQESEEDATINADKAEGSRVLRGFEGDVRGMEEFAKINATDDRAMHVLTGAETKINNTEASVKVNANPNSLNNWVAGVAGKVLGTSFINIQASGRSNLLNHSVQAHGSVLEFYAGGGIRRENHVAQIAPAGAMRIWAEPETGGEAYIPLALGKRPRSEAILAEVADRFGMMLVKAPQLFAEGGTTSTASRPVTAPRTASDGLPRRVILQVGEREFNGLIREVAGEHPGVQAANEFVSTAARYQKAGY